MIDSNVALINVLESVVNQLNSMFIPIFVGFAVSYSLIFLARILISSGFLDSLLFGDDDSQESEPSEDSPAAPDETRDISDNDILELQLYKLSPTFAPLLMLLTRFSFFRRLFISEG